MAVKLTEGAKDVVGALFAVEGRSGLKAAELIVKHINEKRAGLGLA